MAFYGIVIKNEIMTHLKKCFFKSILPCLKCYFRAHFGEHTGESCQVFYLFHQSLYIII